MYCDKDNAGRISINELTAEQLETIRRALIAFRSGLIQQLPFKASTEPLTQYDRAGILLRRIERLNKQ